MNLTFSKVSATVRISNTVEVDLSGGKSARPHAVCFRIDGREKATRGYRVDRLGIMGWEAIDGGEGKTSIKEATALVRRALREMAAQGTLTPSL